MNTTFSKLSSVPLEKLCPALSPEEISFSELEQDEYFPFLEREQIPIYIHTSIQYGEKLAKECVPTSTEMTDVINQIIRKKICVNFVEKDSMDSWIRAQYIRKPPTILISKSSMKQLQDFFNAMSTPVTVEEIVALHLYHEWFHYLEEKKYGRTDSLLPQVIIKKTKLYTQKKRITKTREIAAHAFTQKALNLPWSPLLLDYLLLYQQKGLSKLDIRQKFQDLKIKYKKITEIEDNGIEIE